MNDPTLEEALRAAMQEQPTDPLCPTCLVFHDPRRPATFACSSRATREAAADLWRVAVAEPITRFLGWLLAPGCECPVPFAEWMVGRRCPRTRHRMVVESDRGRRARGG